jgi:prepilin-type N-terminal cleavage/methylation domain
MITVQHNDIQKSARTGRAGFTLIELMIGLVIIGLIVGGGMFAIMGYLEKARRDSTKTALRNIKTFLMFYQTEHGAYPKSLKDLEKEGVLGKNKTTGKYNTLPKDGWNRPFQYRPTEDGYDLYSYGPDGKSGKKETRVTAD